MKVLVKAIRKGIPFFDRIVDWLAYLAGVLLVLTVLFIGIEVASRLLTNQSQIWVIEFSENFLLCITFLATTWVLKRDKHVRMELLLSMLGPRARAFLNMITFMITAVLCLIVAWYSAEVTWSTFQKGTGRPTMVGTPMTPLLAVIVIGYFLLFLQFLRGAFRYFKDWRAN